MTTYAIIQELAETRSRNEKEAILLREVDNTDLKNFFRLALNPMINFYQKKKFTQTETGIVDLRVAMQYLENQIAGRCVTGNNAIENINQLIDSVSEDDGKILMLILQKDSGSEIGAATINKIWPKLIPTFPCLLATAWDDKIANKLDWKSGVISQLKSDAGRCTIIIDNKMVKLFSRAGNELNVFGRFEFLSEYFNDIVIDGELMTVKEDGKFNDRQTSNGIFTRCVRNTLSENESKSLHITVWDVIPLMDFKNESCQLDYSYRFDLLTHMVGKLNAHAHKISLIPSRIVHSVEQALEHYQEMLNAGEEGTIVKSRTMKWENKRSKQQLKLKNEIECSAEVTGIIMGTGKLNGMMGALECRTLDGDILFNVGTGFTEAMRKEINGGIIGKVIDVKYNQIVSDKKTGKKCLFLPVFLKERPDLII